MRLSSGLPTAMSLRPSPFRSVTTMEVGKSGTPIGGSASKTRLPSQAAASGAPPAPALSGDVTSGKPRHVEPPSPPDPPAPADAADPPLLDEPACSLPA